MNDIYEFLRGHSEFRIILEIGAAFGDSTPAIMSSVCWKGGTYFAFEPDPRQISKLNAEGLITVPGFKLVPAAVGAQTGWQTFHPSDGEDDDTHYTHWFSGSLKKPDQHLKNSPWVKFEREIQVRVVKLDDFLWPYGLDRIDFIWCDVQGAEDLVITGAQETLQKTKFLFTEYYEFPMYENQISSEEIKRRLPGNWQVVHKWEKEILFENIT